MSLLAIDAAKLVRLWQLEGLTGAGDADRTSFRKPSPGPEAQDGELGGSWCKAASARPESEIWSAFMLFRVGSRDAAGAGDDGCAPGDEKLEAMSRNGRSSGAADTGAAGAAPIGGDADARAAISEVDNCGAGAVGGDHDADDNDNSGADETVC